MKEFELELISGKCGEPSATEEYITPEEDVE